MLRDMCGRFTLTVKVSELASVLGFEGDPGPPPDPEMAPPRFNVAPTQPVLIVREGSDGVRRAAWAKWGLIPRGAKDPRVGARLINARAETVFEQPAFRSAARSRRCLVPTDGFLEWKKVGKRKQPYHARAPDGGVYAMAGIWSTWRSPEGEEIDTCSVITTEPNGPVSKLHDRMPVILPPEQYDLWLSPEEVAREELSRLLVAAPDDALVLVPVSQRVNSVKHDDPECLEPVEVEGEAPPERPPQLGFGF